MGRLPSNSTRNTHPDDEEGVVDEKSGEIVASFLFWRPSSERAGPLVCVAMRAHACKKEGEILVRVRREERKFVSARRRKRRNVV